MNMHEISMLGGIQHDLEQLAYELKGAKPEAYERVGRLKANVREVLDSLNRKEDSA